MQDPRSVIQVSRFFLAGVVGILAHYAYELFMSGSIEAGFGEIGVYAFIAGVVLSVCELASWIPKTKVKKGIVFGLTLGIVGGTFLGWFHGDGFLKYIVACSIGGQIAGLGYKVFNNRKDSPFPVSDKY